MITDMLYCFPGLDFTVDTSAVNIQVSWPVVPGAVYGEFVNSTGPSIKYFQPKDHLTIISYGVKLPYCFNFSTIVPYFNFGWWQDPNDAILAEISPPTGKLNCPIPNHEFEINTYIPFMPPDVTAETSLAILGGQMSISMVGVPDDLDQVELQLYPFIKVKHNLELEP